MVLQPSPCVRADAQRPSAGRSGRPVYNPAMDKRLKLNLVSVLMLLSALAMFALAVVYGNWAPAVTGVGFAVTAWGFKLMR